MLFCYVFDEKFTVPASVSIYSLLYNNKTIDEIEIIVLDDGITKKSKNILTVMVKQFKRTISFVDVESIKDIIANYTSRDWNGSYAPYIKLMLNTLLPDREEVIYFLDADTIINKSIASLQKIDLKDNPCAMALEAMPIDYYFYSKLGYHELINAGLLVIDLKEWKKHNIEKKVLYFLKNVREKNMLPEEDILSRILKNKITRLAPNYNYLAQYTFHTSKFYYRFFGWDKLFENGAYYSLEELKYAQKNVIVYHCIDMFTNRPWHSNNNHPYTKLFDKYLKMTPFKDYKKEKRKMKLSNALEYSVCRIVPEFLHGFIYAIAVKVYYGVGAKRFYS